MREEPLADTNPKDVLAEASGDGGLAPTGSHIPHGGQLTSTTTGVGDSINTVLHKHICNFMHNTTTAGVGDIINTVLHTNMHSFMHNTAVGTISSSAVTISGKPQYDSPAGGGDSDGFVLTQNVIDYDIDKTNITKQHKSTDVNIGHRQEPPSGRTFLLPSGQMSGDGVVPTVFVGHAPAPKAKMARWPKAPSQK